MLATNAYMYYTVRNEQWHVYCGSNLNRTLAFALLSVVRESRRVWIGYAKELGFIFYFFLLFCSSPTSRSRRYGRGCRGVIFNGRRRENRRAEFGNKFRPLDFRRIPVSRSPSLPRRLSSPLHARATPMIYAGSSGNAVSAHSLR